MKIYMYIGTYNYYIDYNTYYSDVIFRVKLLSHPRVHFCVIIQIVR